GVRSRHCGEYRNVWVERAGPRVRSDSGYAPAEGSGRATAAIESQALRQPTRGDEIPMATQTPIQRQAAAKRAAATRKRNDAKRSATATKASGRRTRAAASSAARTRLSVAGRMR